MWDWDIICQSYYEVYGIEITEEFLSDIDFDRFYSNVHNMSKGALRELANFRQQGRSERSKPPKKRTFSEEQMNYYKDIELPSNVDIVYYDNLKYN